MKLIAEKAVHSAFQVTKISTYSFLFLDKDETHYTFISKCILPNGHRNQQGRQKECPVDSLLYTVSCIYFVLFKVCSYQITCFGLCLLSGAMDIQEVRNVRAYPDDHSFYNRELRETRMVGDKLMEL